MQEIIKRAGRSPRKALVSSEVKILEWHIEIVAFIDLTDHCDFSSDI